MDKVMVGIDVAKAALDVHALSAGEAFTVTRDAARIRRADREAPAAGTGDGGGGGHGWSRERGDGELGSAGLPVVLVNPAQVRAFAQALGKRAKTDPIDAAGCSRG